MPLQRNYRVGRSRGGTSRPCDAQPTQMQIRPQRERLLRALRQTHPRIRRPCPPGIINYLSDNRRIVGFTPTHTTVCITRLNPTPFGAASALSAISTCSLTCRYLNRYCQQRYSLPSISQNSEVERSDPERALRTFCTIRSLQKKSVVASTERGKFLETPNFLNSRFCGNDERVSGQLLNPSAL